MSQVVSFEDYVPIPRYDSVAWSTVRIEEATTATGPWTQIDELAISPLDSDPSQPATRNFTTSLASDTPLLWYRLIFVDAASATEGPTQPIQNGPQQEPYATVDELAQLLRVRASDREVALRRVLMAAAEEIDAEIGLAERSTLPSPLMVEVNLERAVEHWQQMQSPFGIIGLGDTPAAYTARDSWDRHAHKLAPLKVSWGVA